MPWAKLDDALTFHAKIIDAGNAATGVWARGLAWSSQHLTDGFIPTKIARVIAGESRGALGALTRSRLWVDRPGGYQINDYLEYNPSRAEVLAKREKDRIRKAGNSERRPGGTEAASEPPVPSRPVPVPIEQQQGNGRAASYSEGGPIRSTADLEVAAAAWGWSISLTGSERGNCHRLTSAGPIEPHEIASARRSSVGKDRPVAYFLTVVESERRKYEQTSSGSSPGARPAKRSRSGIIQGSLDYIEQGRAEDEARGELPENGNVVAAMLRRPKE
jgi:hypothetical protein